MQWRTLFTGLACLLFAASLSAFAQPANGDIAGFESSSPSFWTKGNQPSGTTLTWATDQFRSMGQSLKIDKPAATSDSAAWISENMADIWSPTFGKDVDILLGAYIKTSGVNTAPANDDARWFIVYTFYDKNGTLLNETRLPIDQTTATSTGWVADTNQVGETILSADAAKLIIKFVAGKNATGTVWADDFVFYGRGAWAGQDWNTGVIVPTGWFYWLPPNGGNDGVLTNGFENTLVTTEAAHSGTHSLKFNLPAGRTAHDGFVGTRRMSFADLGIPNLKPGDSVKVSVWVKASGLQPDSAAAHPGSWGVGLTGLFFATVDPSAGYNPAGPDSVFTFPPVTNFDWTQYSTTFYVPKDSLPTTGGNKGPVMGLEARLHVYSTFVGTVYFDDLAFERIPAGGASLADIMGFEPSLPSFWTKGNQPSGTTLTWATDQFRSMGQSLKIDKPAATSDSAAWISENMADIWSPTFGKDVDILLGAYIKTSGVNTAPANDDARWFIVYTFYDKNGTLLNETRLPIDQTTATSTGWVADTNQVGETILSADAAKLIIKFVAGKNATGTVWADDFVFYGRGAWAGQDWNTGVIVPTGWFYWLPPNGGNDGVLTNGFENTLVTTEAAHSGTHSLKFNLPAGRTAHDGFVATRRMSFADLGIPNLKPGDSVKVSVWVKASGLQPDSAAAHPGSWGVGLTGLFFATVDPSAGYNPAGPDSVFTFPPVTNFDWTQYSTTFYVPKDSLPTTGGNKGPVMGLEARLHVYSTFVGTVYFDDLAFERIPAGGASLADIMGFEPSLPSFWTKGNQPSGTTLTWATDQFRSMGQSLKIDKPAATSDSAAWISENMADIWSPTFGKDVDILLGAYIKTSGVNTAPANDDARWFIVYTFYDKNGTLLNETRLPIDQTTATSTGWVADTNQVGETILSADAAKLIIKFVAGKNATGTVWADDFVFYGRGAWAGQDWNTGVIVPTGWFYWLPPNGGNDGVLTNGFENTLVTTEAAHSGTHSLKFNLPAGRTAHDGFVATRRMSFADLGIPNLKPGDSVKVSVWVKASGLQPDSAAAHPGSWGVGLTGLFFATVDPSAGYNPAGPDSVFTFPPVTNFDWTQYSTTFYVPKDSLPTTGGNKGPVMGLEARLHVYSTFVGTVYFDDVTFTRIAGTTSVEQTADNGLPKVFELSNNYPNPFNPSTQIQYAVPRASNVKLVIFNVLGQQVRTLVDAPQNAGRFTVTWDGRDHMGHVVGSGVYFYRLNAGETTLVKKMLMLK